MMLERFKNFSPSDFIFKIATEEPDLEGFHELRRQIFCHEQGVFEADDRDLYDNDMIPIVCKSILAGMEDSVAGVVRIDEREPGVWYGSRLGVATAFRRIRSFSPSVSVRNLQPCYHGLGALGAGLIYKAVSTANAIGATSFSRRYSIRMQGSFNGFTGSHWRKWRSMDLSM